MADHQIMFLHPYNLKKEVWSFSRLQINTHVSKMHMRLFTTWKSTWKQKHASSKNLPSTKQPKSNVVTPPPSKIGTTDRMWKHQLQTNMSEPIHVKSCPERSIQNWNHQTSRVSQVFLVHGTFSSTFFVGNRLHRSVLVVLRSESLKIQSFCWGIFWLQDSFEPPIIFGTRKVGFLDFRKPRYISDKLLASCGHLFGFCYDFLKFSGKKWCWTLILSRATFFKVS